MNHKLITFSGIDGAGKSTQLNQMIQRLSERRQPFVYLWTRGGYTPGINFLKELSRKLAGRKLPPSGNSSQREHILGKGWVQKVWLTIAILDLIRIYGIQIRLWLMQGKVVLCDRYLWDTLIDFQIMFPNIHIDKWYLWNALVRVTPKPTAQTLLMIPLDLSEKRCNQKYEPFPDSLERRAKRYALYMEASNRYEWKIIDATMSADNVFKEIRSIIE